MEAAAEDAPLVDPEAQSIDTIISRLGFGPYQKYIFFIAGIGQAADGIEMTAIAVLTPVLQDEWGLSLWQMGLLGGVIFLGMIIGNGVSAYVGDTTGRLPMMRKSTLLMFIAAFASGLMPEYWSFLFARFFVGLAAGLLIPIASSYATEVCPKDIRGKFLVGMGICFIAGMLLIILLAIVFLSAFGGGSWRIVLILAALPILVAYIMLLFTIKESPRFLASRKRHAEAIDVLNFMGEMNQKPSLTGDEEKILIQYQPLAMEKGFGKVNILFKEQYRRNTYQLMFLWFSAVFTYYGLLFILPQTLGADGLVAMYGILLLTALIQIPAIGVNVLTIDHKSFGRKMTIVICLVAQTVCFAGAVVMFGTLGFLACVVFAMFFISIWFSTLYPYTGELYHTTIRSLAYGTLNVVARSGGALAPIMLLELSAMNPAAPYVLLTLVSLAASIDAALLPHETRNVALDQDGEEPINEDSKPINEENQTIVES